MPVQYKGDFNLVEPSPDSIEKPWTAKELFNLIKCYWTGKNHVAYGKSIGRDGTAVQMKLSKCARDYNDGEWPMLEKVLAKMPMRTGKPWTKRDTMAVNWFTAKWKTDKTPCVPDKLAAFMRRPKSEIKPYVSVTPRRTLFDQPASKPAQRQAKQLEKQTRLLDVRHMTTDEDALLAHRYLYYVTKTPILDDSVYDQFEAEALEYGNIPKDSLVRKPGSDRKEDYPDHVQAFALYLGLKYMKRRMR